MDEDQAVARLIKQVVGAAFEVSNQLGHGFLEPLYQRALLHELECRGIEAEREVRYNVTYKGHAIGTYIADLVVADVLIVELKAVDDLTGAHIGQLLNYLKAANLRKGLLLNFGQTRVKFREITRKPY